MELATPEQTLSPDLHFPQEIHDIGKDIVFLHIDTIDYSIFSTTTSNTTEDEACQLLKYAQKYIKNVSLVSKKHYEYVTKPTTVRQTVGNIFQRLASVKSDYTNHQSIIIIFGQVARLKYWKCNKSFFDHDLTPEQFESFVQEGADVNYSEHSGTICRWPLIFWVWKNNIDNAKKLLALGADINQTSLKADSTCLYWAMYHDNYEMIKLLLEYKPHCLDLNYAIQLKHEEKIANPFIFGALAFEAEKRGDGNEQLSNALVKAIELKKETITVFLTKVHGAPTQAAIDFLLSQIMHSIVDKKDITKETKLLEILTSSSSNNTVHEINEYLSNILSKISEIQNVLEVIQQENNTK